MTIITSIRAAMRLLFLTGQNTSTRSGVSSIFGPALNADIASKPRQLCVPMPDSTDDAETMEAFFPSLLVA